MKKLIVMMLALVVAFSFTACNNDTPQPGNEGSIDVPSPAGAVPEEIYAEVYNLESIVLDAYRDGQASILEESFAYRYYNADDVLIATVDTVNGLPVITVAKDGVHLKAGDKVVQTTDPTDETSYVYVYADSKEPLSDEAYAEMLGLQNSFRKMVITYSRSYSCTSTIEGKDVIFNNDVDYYIEYRFIPENPTDPENPEGTPEGVVTLRHAVTISGYDGLSSYVLYRQMTGPEDDRIVIEVDGTAYSLAQKDDSLGLYGLIGSMMG